MECGFSPCGERLTGAASYQRHVPPAWQQRYIIAMSTGTGHAKYRCGQCEMPEEQCICDKFCCLCQSPLEIRICTDGLMYCEPCRNACDYKTSDDSY